MEKLSKLIDRLLDRSERGLIDWQPTADDEMFQFSLADGTVRISYRPEINRYYFSVVNSFGQVVDSASDKDIDDAVIPFESFYELMRRLYDLARRKAFRAEETLDGILAELGE